MKFIFKNLGPIHKAELELGDLTIIAGRNNTGKTYVAYTLYGFLRTWIASPEFFEVLDELSQRSLFPDFSDDERIAKTVMSEGRVKWHVAPERLHLQQKLVMREVARSFSKGELARVFNVVEKDFEDASIKIVIENEFPEYGENEIVHGSRNNDFTITYTNDEICISRSRVGRKPLSASDVLFSLTDTYLSFLFPKLPAPFILSAERFGISLFYKELDFTKNRLVEIVQETGRDRGTDGFLPFLLIDKMASRYAMPIKDNIDYTRDISEHQKRRSELYDSELFKGIRYMLGGYYRSSGDDIRFISQARKARRFDIPLHIASSSVRGLSDLYFFLRHVAHKNQLLIIDEPESHLDTANQIQFARLLAHAVHAGLKVLITTHSDYIVKEINNLLMLSKSFKDKPKVLKKYKYLAHDFLKSDSVRAYVAEDNSLTPCKIDRFGIDMPIFDTTIDTINRVSSELGSRLTYEGEE